QESATIPVPQTQQDPAAAPVLQTQKEPATTSVAQAQQAPAAASMTLTLDQLVDRISKAEAALTSRMRAFHPLVEVYIQNLAPDPKLGTVPIKDDYFLGQFDGKDGPDLIQMSRNKGSFNP